MLIQEVNVIYRGRQRRSPCATKLNTALGLGMRRTMAYNDTTSEGVTTESLLARDQVNRQRCSAKKEGTEDIWHLLKGA